jgi:outer membrane receptor protein involved in Fe transport
MDIFYWWRKPEYPEKTTDLPQVIRKSSSLDGGVELDGYTLINLSSSYAINNNAKVLLNIKN